MNSLRFTGITLIAIAAGCFNPNYTAKQAGDGFACNTSTNECPSGYTCTPVTGGVDTDQGVCTKSASSGGGTASGDGLEITKTGTYMAPTADPMLTTEAACPDASLEPDDDFGQAVPLPNLGVDAGALNLKSLSICPTGNNPKAKNHDVDFYKIVVPSSSTAVVNIVYDIQFGDLDLGIFDTSGKAIVSDGTSVSNACVATSLQAGTYFVGVFGAMNVDVNRYTMSVKLTSAASTCN